MQVYEYTHFAMHYAPICSLFRIHSSSNSRKWRKFNVSVLYTLEKKAKDSDFSEEVNLPYLIHTPFANNYDAPFHQFIWEDQETPTTVAECFDEHGDAMLGIALKEYPSQVNILKCSLSTINVFVSSIRLIF